jgi:hypothetical protein
LPDVPQKRSKRLNARAGGNSQSVPRRAVSDVWGANPVLLLSGAVSMIVAIVGLFVRASPTLSGAFLVIGSALIVIAVFERRGHVAHEVVPDPPDVSRAALQRSVAAAESELERGRIRGANDVVADR